MSTKYFCDVCKCEMPASELCRVKRQSGRIKVEVMHALDNTWNAGHACHACIIRIVKDGEPAS